MNFNQPYNIKAASVLEPRLKIRLNIAAKSISENSPTYLENTGVSAQFNWLQPDDINRIGQIPKSLKLNSNNA